MRTPYFAASRDCKVWSLRAQKGLPGSYGSRKTTIPKSVTQTPHFCARTQRFPSSRPPDRLDGGALLDDGAADDNHHRPAHEADCGDSSTAVR